MACLNLTNPEVKEWINGVGIEETYTQYVLHNYNLPTYKSFLEYSDSNLTQVELQELQSRILNTSNYKYDFIDKIRTLAPSAQAAFMRDTFYFADKANKYEVLEESFHAIFQTIATSQEKKALYNEAKKYITKEQFKSLKKIYKESLNQKLTEEQLELYVLEEILAKEFVNSYLKGSMISNITKQSFSEKVIAFFQKIKDLINSFFKNNYAKEFFNKIHSGKYSLETARYDDETIVAPSQKILTLVNEDGDSFILDVDKQRKMYSRIRSIIYGLIENSDYKELTTKEERVKDAIDFYFQELLNTSSNLRNEFTEEELNALLFRYNRDFKSKKTTKVFIDIIYSDIFEEYQVSSDFLESLQDEELTEEEEIGGQSFQEMSSENADKIDHLKKFKQHIRAFISNIVITEEEPVTITKSISKQVKLDEENNPIYKDIKVTVPVQRMANHLKIYSLVTRSASNSLSEFETLKKIVLLTDKNTTNEDTRAFIKEIIKNTFTYSNINSVLELIKKSNNLEDLRTKVKEHHEIRIKNEIFLKNIMKPFDLWKRSYNVVIVDGSGKGNFNVFNPIYTNVINKQLDVWRVDYETTAKNKLNDNEINETLEQLNKENQRFQNIGYKTNYDKVFDKLKYTLNYFGISVSDDYIKYSIAHQQYYNIKKLITNKFIEEQSKVDSKIIYRSDLNEELQAKLDNEINQKFEEKFQNYSEYKTLFDTFRLDYQDVFKFEDLVVFTNTYLSRLKTEYKQKIKDKTEDEINIIADNFLLDYNPYDKELYIELEDGSKTVGLKQQKLFGTIAKGNSYFDESVIATTFLDSDNKTRYGLQYHTPLLEFTERTVKDRALFREHYEELIHEHSDNRFAFKNSLSSFIDKLTNRDRAKITTVSYAGAIAEEFDEQGNKKISDFKRSTVNEETEIDWFNIQANIAAESLEYLTDKQKDSTNIITKYFVGNPEVSNTRSFFTGLWHTEVVQFFSDTQETKITNKGTNLYLNDLVFPQLERIFFNLEFIKQNKSFFKLGQQATIKEIENNAEVDKKYTIEQLVEGYHTTKNELPFVKGSNDVVDLKALYELKGLPRALEFSHTTNSILSEKTKKEIYNLIAEEKSLDEIKNLLLNIDVDLITTEETLENDEVKKTTTKVLQSSIRESIKETINKYLNESVNKINEFTSKKFESENIKGFGFFNAATTNQVKKEQIVDFNIKLFAFNALLNRESFHRMYMGDSSIINKNSAEDTLKRFKFIESSGQTARTEFTNQKYGIDKPFLNFKILPTKDGTTIPSISGVTEQKVDDTDGGSHSSVNHFRYTLFGLGKLNSTLVNLLDVLESGRKLTKEQEKMLFSSNSYINLLKTRYSGLQTDLKHSETPLYKRLTAFPEEIQISNWEDYVEIIPTLEGKSYIVKNKIRDNTLPYANDEITVEFLNGDITDKSPENIKIYKWISITEELNDKRLLLEGWRKINKKWEYKGVDFEIGMVVPESVLKRKKQNIWDFNFNNFTENNLQTLNAGKYKEQVPNPAGKDLITLPSQQFEIILNPFDENAILTIDGEKRTAKQVANSIAEIVAKKDSITLSQALQDLINENGDPTLKKLYKAWQENIIETGGDRQMIELLEVDSKGQPLYNGNLPILKNKFENFFYSHFSKNALIQKVPGDAKAMSSPKGYGVVKRLIKIGDKYNWEVISKSDSRYLEALKKAKENNLSDKGLTYNGYLYENQFEQNKNLNTLIDTLDTIYNANKESNKPIYFLDELRHLVPQYEEGEFIGYFSEAVVPKWNINQTKVESSFKYANGVRIPSQDLTTSANVVFVDLEEAALGNTIWIAKEIQELAGADYDIDKIYLTIKDGYWEAGQYKLYENTFEDFKRFQLERNKSIKNQIKDLLKENTEYQELTNKINNFKSLKKDLKKVFDLIDDYIGIKTENRVVTIKLFKDYILGKYSFNKTLEKKLEEYKKEYSSLKDKRTKKAKDLKKLIISTYNELDTLEQFIKNLLDIKSKSQSLYFEYKNEVIKEAEELEKLYTEKDNKYNEIVNKVLKQNNLPTTEEEWNNLSKDKKENIGVLNNQMLDSYFQLLTSNYNSYSEPTSIEPLRNLKNNSELLKLIDFNPVEDVSVNSPLYDTVYRSRIASALKGIGTLVNSNLVWNSLSKLGVKLNPKYQFKINGVLYDGFSKQMLSDTSGKSVGSWISTFTTATTDEAKEGVLAGYRLFGEALDFVATGLTQGIHPEISIAMLNLPYIKDLFEDQKNSPLSKGGKKSVLSILKEEYKSTLEKREGEDKKEFNLNTENLKKELQNSQEIKQEERVELEEAAIVILTNILELNEQNKEYIKLIRLKRGLGAEYLDFARIINAAQNLGIFNQKQEKQIITPYSVELKNVYQIPIQKTGLKQIYNYVREVLPSIYNETEKHLLYGNKVFNQIYVALLEQFQVKPYDVKEFNKEIETILLAELHKIGEEEYENVNGYNPFNVKLKTTYELFIGENSLANRYLKIINNPEYKEIVKNNRLFQLLKPQLGSLKTAQKLKRRAENRNKTLEEIIKLGNIKDIDTLQLNIFSKLTPEVQSSIMDSYYSLLMGNRQHPEITEFLQDLYSYFFIKDGLNYSPVGLSKIFNPYFFSNVSEQLTNFLKEKKTPKEVEELKEKVLKRIGKDVRNKKYIPKSFNIDKNYNIQYDQEDVSIVKKGSEEQYDTQTFKYARGIIFARQNENTQTTLSKYNILDSSNTPKKYIKVKNNIYQHVRTLNQVDKLGNAEYKEHIYLALPELGIKGLYTTILDNAFSLNNKELDVIISSLETQLSFLNKEKLSFKNQALKDLIIKKLVDYKNLKENNILNLNQDETVVEDEITDFSEIENVEEKNTNLGFEVKVLDKVPEAEKIKAPFKSRNSIGFIGFGEKGTSTAYYAEQYKEKELPVNPDIYTKDGVYFASQNGGKNAIKTREKTLAEIVKALEQEAKVLLDSKKYIDSSNYNKEGEDWIYKQLESLGYKQQKTTNENVIMWYKEYTKSESKIGVKIDEYLGLSKKGGYKISISKTLNKFLESFFNSQDESIIEPFAEKLTNEDKKVLAKAIGRNYKDINQFDWYEAIWSDTGQEEVFYYLKTGFTLEEKIQEEKINSKLYKEWQSFVKENKEFVDNFYNLPKEIQKEQQKDFNKLKEKNEWYQFESENLEYDIRKNLLKKEGYFDWNNLSIKTEKSIQEFTNTEKTITYKPKGKERQTYRIIGNKIFNKENKEVFKENSVDRNRIFANLAVKEGRAKIVELSENEFYVVNNKLQIISGTTGKIMQWEENNGKRKQIIDIYNKIIQTDTVETETLEQPTLEELNKRLQENSNKECNS